MGWFHAILRAYGLPVKPAKPPLAAVQHLVINNGADPKSLDPHKTSSVPEANIIDDLLEGLFIFDRHGEVVPGMALYAYSSNKKTWSFHMRPGVKWSNGDPLDARDFVYSWRRLADPKTASPSADSLRSMKVANIDEILAGKLPPEALGVKALGPLTLHITLSQPLGFLKQLLVDSSLLPVHQSTIERHGDEWTQVKNWVGNGAYCPKEQVVNEKVVLSRNPNYWDNNQTVIDQVTYLPRNEEAELAGYRSGAIDITHAKIPTKQLQKLQPEFPEEYRLFPTPAVRGYLFNTKNPPFNDVRVRQALNLALDRKFIMQQLLMPEKYLAYNVVPDGLGGLKAYQPDWISWSFEQRLQMAKKLLQDAGFGPHHPLCFTLLYNTTEFNKQLGLIVRTLWDAHLGVKVTLLNQEWKTFLDTTSTGNYQAAYRSVSDDSGEPYGLLGDYLSYSCRNETGYNSPTFDNLLDKALDSLYAAERSALYHKAEAQLAEDVPLIPLLHPAVMRLVKPYVVGLSDRNTMNRFYTKDLHIAKHPLAPQKVRQ
ncbi:ABC transporter substrate-binding protein [unidentified bacterial endosymbiont]|uniref:ABC transporter substrate-binding protein n=1 Tax=unidentified bacterial endosymbiont TaxID=2355 RepID=UPI00209C91AB|nr:ABC transporter substrate-binding protein [unidentified bacterial endosymbiont]